ncbi:hypothetical protein, partial [[Eubacterium] cellulosolvens]
HTHPNLQTPQPPIQQPSNMGNIQNRPIVSTQQAPNRNLSMQAPQQQPKQAISDIKDPLK